MESLNVTGEEIEKGEALIKEAMIKNDVFSLMGELMKICESNRGAMANIILNYIAVSSELLNKNETKDFKH